MRPELPLPHVLSGALGLCPQLPWHIDKCVVPTGGGGESLQPHRVSSPEGARPLGMGTEEVGGRQDNTCSYFSNRSYERKVW